MKNDLILNSECWIRYVLNKIPFCSFIDSGRKYKFIKRCEQKDGGGSATELGALDAEYSYSKTNLMLLL